MSGEEVIPVVDFAAYSLEVNKSDVNQDSREELVKQIYDAFSRSGIVFLKNHGITQREVDEVNRQAAQFFSLSNDVKQKYKRGKLVNDNGWVPFEGESVSPNRPADKKEVYDVKPWIDDEKWPDKEVPALRTTVTDLYDSCRELSSRVLELLALGLNLSDAEFFNKHHRPDLPTVTHVRLLYYPATTEDIPITKESPLRIGEHTDSGSMTLLFQDGVGGLQGLDGEGKFVSVPTIPDTVLVFLGDLMQRWTSDKLKAIVHRVVNPTSQGQTKIIPARQSIACFISPHEDCLIESIDGGSKYPPVLAKDHIQYRYDTFYRDMPDAVDS